MNTTAQPMTTSDDGFANLRQMPLPELCDHIETRYHETLRSHLDLLMKLVEEVNAVHDSGLHPGLQPRLRRGREDLLSHLAKEERVLFPAVRRGMGPQLEMPMRVMEHEHNVHGDFLSEIRFFTNAFELPSGVGETFRELYRELQRLEAELHEHVFVENEILFPRMRQRRGV